MIKVYIATTNKEKTEGIKEAFIQKFGTENIRVNAFKTESGVSDQPSNEEVLRGAVNRLNNLVESMTGKIESADSDEIYFVAVEGGLIHELEFWNNEHYVVIKHAGIVTMGKGRSFRVPNAVAEDAIKRGSLHLAMVDRGKDVKSLTGFSRVEIVRDATASALLEW